MELAPILAKVLERPQVARVMRVLDIYGHAAGGLLANGLAFVALFAAIPAALVVLGVGGWIAAGSPEALDRLAAALIRAFPPLADLIEGALTAIGQGAALTSILGVLGVIWTVSQFYGALDVAFARIFAEAPERDMVRRTARGLVVVVLIGLAIVAFVVLVSVATYFDAVSPTEIPIATLLVSIIRSVPFLIALAILSQVFTVLVPRLVGVAALAGSLASAFIALAWLSFTFQALLYGAAWVRVNEELADGKASSVSASLGGPAAPAEPGGGGE
jgi:uncharacterized BrkB/YihY/UPF0761 family membrane protein